MLTDDEKKLLRTALCDPRFVVVLKQRVTPELLANFSTDDELVRLKLVLYKTKITDDINKQIETLKANLSNL